MVLAIGIHGKVVDAMMKIERATYGGRCLVVGGAVRDRILGLDPRDWDLVVFGSSAEELTRNLRGFQVIDTPGFEGITVGLWNGYEIQVARPGVTAKQDALRRDFKVNAMYAELSGIVSDPLGGLANFDHGVLEPCSYETFLDSKDRPLRAAMMVARFGLTPTVELCTHIWKNPVYPPIEQVWRILEKIFRAETGRPPSSGWGGRFEEALRFMLRCGLMELHMPQLYKMCKVDQDFWYHPEGDVLEHSIQVAGLGKTALERWAGLAHDLGKLTTSDTYQAADGRWRIKSPDHVRAGAEFEKRLLDEVGMPTRGDYGRLRNKIAALRETHMTRPTTSAGIRRLIVRLSEADLTIEDWWSFCRNDINGRRRSDGEEADGRAEAIDEIYAVVKRAESDKSLKDVVKMFVNGNDVLSLGRSFGIKQGPVVGDILARAKESQIEGHVSNRQEALQDLREIIIKVSGSDITTVHKGDYK